MRKSHLAFGAAVAVAAVLCLAPSTEAQKSKSRAATAATFIDTAGVTFDPNASVPQLLESAREMFINDSYKLSEMLYKSVLIRDPDNLSALLELAVLYEATGQLQYARGLLSRALVLKPHDRDIIERNNRIVQTLSRTVEDDVNELLAKQSWQKALPKLGLLLAAEPENADLYYKRAQCHLGLGHPQNAVTEITKAIDLGSGDPRYDALLDEALRLVDEREIEGLKLRAQAYLRLGTNRGDEGALEMIGGILEIDPDEPWAREQFARLTDSNGGPPPRSQARGFFDRSRDAIGSVVVPTASWLYDFAGAYGPDVEILLFVLLALLVLNSPLTSMLVRGFSPRQSLSGRLKDFSIKEILSLINTHHLTGALKIRSSKRRGWIYFSRGEVCHCRSRREDGREALQKLLRCPSTGYFVFHEGKKTSERTVETPLSLILLELPERTDTSGGSSSLSKRSRMSELLESRD